MSEVSSPEDLLAFVKARVDSFRREVAALEELTLEVKAHRSEMQRDVIAATRRHAWAVYEGDQSIARGLIQSLYWDYPELPAKHIAEAFGLTLQSPVFERLRGNSPGQRPCERCGVAIAVEYTSRSDKAMNRTYRLPRYCEICRPVIEAELRDRHERASIRWRAEEEREQRLREIAVSGPPCAICDRPLHSIRDAGRSTHPHCNAVEGDY